MLFHKKIQSQFRYCRAFFVERHDTKSARWNEIACKIWFFCVAARVYEGASYQLFEKMSKYTVSVKSILNVTKVRCTSTYQTSFSSSLCRCLTLNEMYFQFSTGNNLVDGLFFWNIWKCLTLCKMHFELNVFLCLTLH